MYVGIRGGGKWERMFGRLHFLIFLFLLRNVHTRTLTLQPRVRVARGQVSQAEVAVPCLSKDFDGTWIPELQSLTGKCLKATVASLVCVE